MCHVPSSFPVSELNQFDWVRFMMMDYAATVFQEAPLPLIPPGQGDKAAEIFQRVGGHYPLVLGEEPVQWEIGPFIAMQVGWVVRVWCEAGGGGLCSFRIRPDPPCVVRTLPPAGARGRGEPSRHNADQGGARPAANPGGCFGWVLRRCFQRAHVSRPRSPYTRAPLFSRQGCWPINQTEAPTGISDIVGYAWHAAQEVHVIAARKVLYEKDMTASKAMAEARAEVRARRAEEEARAKADARRAEEEAHRGAAPMDTVE